MLQISCYRQSQSLPVKIAKVKFTLLELSLELLEVS
jgi:hypothetical protein